MRDLKSERGAVSLGLIVAIVVALFLVYSSDPSWSPSISFRTPS